MVEATLEVITLGAKVVEATGMLMGMERLIWTAMAKERGTDPRKNDGGRP